MYSDIYLCKGYSSVITPIYLFAKHGKRKGEAKKEYDILQFLWEKHYHQEKRLCIPNPIYYADTIDTLFTERVSGIPLAQTLRYKSMPLWWRVSNREIEEYINNAAIWLKSFHIVTGQSKKISLESSIETDSSKIAQHPPACLSKKVVEHCISKLRKLAINLNAPPHNKTGRHGDYYHENIIISPQKTTVIDFAQFNYGTPLYDIAQFIVNLEIYGNFRFYNTDFFHSLANLFLATYNEFDKESTTSFSRDAVSLYKIQLLLDELKWSELINKETPSSNPFANHFIRLTNRYAINGIKNFIKK